MSVSFSNAVKSRQLRDYFHRHGRIYIVVDTTAHDVELPEHLIGDPSLRLILNVRMPQVIDIRDHGIESVFTFGGTPYSCRIPMNAIWAAYPPEGEIEEGLVWEESIPELIKAVLEEAYNNINSNDLITESHETSKPETITEEEVVAPKLSAVEESKDTHTKPKAASKKRVGNHLRVVK